MKEHESQPNLLTEAERVLLPQKESLCNSPIAQVVDHHADVAWVASGDGKTTVTR